MKLKHEWTPPQEKIILAAKKHLKRNSFHIKKEVFASSQILLEKKGIAFYEAWDEITEEFSDILGCNFWYLIFCNTIFHLFKQKNTVSFSELCKELDFLQSLDDHLQGIGSYNLMLIHSLDEKGYSEEEVKVFRELLFGSAPVCRLPVRLQGGLKAAVKELDLPRIITLYDMVLQPGEKLKYIYHAILNERRYDYFLFLLERYGNSGSLSPNVLELHFLMPGMSEDKQRFNHFYCSNFGKNDPDFWSKAAAYGILDTVIPMALECGIDPGAYIVRQNGYKIPMRDFLYLVNEVSDEFKIHLSRWNPESKSYKYWNSILRASEIFSQWEIKSGNRCL